jgi:signal transduction histidine kinase/ActR/RegA family two-component response regulator
MFTLHVSTVFAFTTLLSASIGALLISLWVRDRGQPALASWGVARLLGAVAMPLLATRGLIPDWISINLANTIVCLSYGLTWGGARQFEGRIPRPSVMLSGAVVWLLACEVPAIYDSLEYRVALLGFILACYNLAAAHEFRRGQTNGPLPSRPLIVAVLVMTALIYGVCGVAPLLVPFKEQGLSLPGALWFGLLVSLSVGLLTGSAVLLVALIKEQAELRSTTALAAARDLATEASEQKTRFLARMSHELRTPLNGVLGLAQVLARDPDQGERQRRQAATLEQAGRHLLAILNEVLDLSRIEAGRLELTPDLVIMAEFLRDAVALARGTAVSKSVTLTVSVASDLPDAVRADPMRLRQILLNLLNNALKFTQDGGRVTLAVTPGSGDRICFAVTDTGPGVPEALRPRLFQDYAQALGEHAAGSSGLGLAISARLAHAMGGDLTHSDGPNGIGSCFTLVLRLPAMECPAAVPAVPLPAAPDRRLTAMPGRLQILVVDDVSLNRTTVRAMLEHAGHIVDLAEDGPAALAAVVRGPLPDVILMDQSMPGMDGYTTARRIRAMPGQAGRLPIVAVTANALPEDIAASVAAGMDGHVVKPIELRALLAAITRALGRVELEQQAAD